jgi:pSer/pThr/pTyr-binding forkhead associated (FHA) protein
MVPKLIDLTGDAAREIAIHGEEFLIGRGADCDLRLPASAISRHHCLLRFRGNQASVADLGSSNGTFVNGKRLRSQTELRTGDEITVGEAHFLIDLGDGINHNDADSIASTRKMGRPPAKSQDSGQN